VAGALSLSARNLANSHRLLAETRFNRTCEPPST